MKLSIGRWRQLRGKQTEESFFAAHQERTDSTPEWFVKVRRASPYLDRNGVDARAYIKMPNRNRYVCVPIQIKTSWFGLKKYWIKRPDPIYKESVVVIVVRPFHSYEQIRWHTYLLLKEVRDKGKRYNDFFKAVEIKAAA